MDMRQPIPQLSKRFCPEILDALPLPAATNLVIFGQESIAPEAREIPPINSELFAKIHRSTRTIRSLLPLA